ncbi:MAG: low-specificity L-threonine aldolase [Candidatus Hodarchaeota archaeon]
MEHIIDFRSDTVTLPTEEMLEAIKTARLGDDVVRDDPTVHELEELAARIFGKEAGLLVPSGTQGNLVSLLSHTQPGNEVIVDREAHIYYYEVGGLSRIGGLLARPLDGSPNGFLKPEEVEASIRVSDIHQPVSRLVCLENTHNRYGGAIITPNEMAQLYEVVNSHDLFLHLDGARIFNAAVALDCSVGVFAKYTDSIMFCLSKGLSAPIGSVVVGSSPFIERARRFRKLLGGGMRQAGIIAAPGIVALKKMVNRLKEDHIFAEKLGKGLSDLGCLVNPVQTNVVMFSLEPINMTSLDFLTELKHQNILAYSMGPYKIRFVTHRGINAIDIKIALEKIEEIIKNRNKKPRKNSSLSDVIH